MTTRTAGEVARDSIDKLTAEELAAETSTERVVRLALKAGQRAGELERVKAENARTSGVV